MTDRSRKRDNPELTRRRFLGWLGLGTAVTVAAPMLLEEAVTRRFWALGSPAPTLWGDGIHDDTAAIQWLIDHPNSRGWVLIPKGIVGSTFRVVQPIVLGGTNRLYEGGAREGRRFLPDHDDARFVIPGESENLTIQNWWFDHRMPLADQATGIRVELRRFE